MIKARFQGLDLLITRDALRIEAYRDTKGIVTIGLGHTGSEVLIDLVWTVERCREVFARDIERLERAVNDYDRVPLKQHEFDVLVRFWFNCGENALAHGGGGPSSIPRALNSSDHAGSVAAFDAWMRDPAVRTRRADEREQFRGAAFEAWIG